MTRTHGTMLHRLIRSQSGALPLLAAIFALTACGGPASSGPASSPRITVSTEPLAADETVAESLPNLTVSQVEVATGPVLTVQRLEVVNEDLRVVLRSLAQNFDLDYRIDPAVTGRVTARFQDVTLDEALQELVVPQGYAYQLEGGVLRVVPAVVQTRIFSLDYLALTRMGIGTTIVQRRLGNTSTGTNQNIGGQFNNQFFGGGGGADLITSISVNDLWQEMRIALEGLVFDAPAVGSAATTSPQTSGAIPLGSGGIPGLSGSGGLGSGQIGGTSAAYSRTDSDGRRLILNPLSGTILVAAPPSRLAEVEAFLATVEGSIQRQVLIEARIVEVSLNRRAEFGIDWNVISQLGGIDLNIGGGSSGAEFRLARSEDPSVNEVNLVLRALQQQGDVRVLSSPRVSVLNNQRAAINVSTDEVFFAVTRQPILGPDGGTIGFSTEVQPQQISVGISLDVYPQIGPDNSITMSVRPVITDVLEVRELILEDGTQFSAPVIDRRETDTVVRVRGGETIVIGGLIQNSQRSSDTGIPILSRIPLIGRLFTSFTRSDTRRELVIFLTPTIIAGQAPLGS